MDKIDLKGMGLDELERFFETIGELPFRAKQMMKWMYLRGENDFEVMTDFSKKLRSKLTEHAFISSLKIVKNLKSSDGETEKFLFELEDGEIIESVLMSYEERIGPSRLTACISTQVGCAMGCKFCATAKNGFIRNLTSAEIADQILRMQKIIAADEKRIANIVMMGMGEPLLNYDNVFSAIRLLNHSDSIAIGIRHITISTCGIVPEIKRLSEEGLQVKLAVSIHSPFDEVRTSLMPINRKYPLKDLMAALKNYQDKTNRRITFEYALIKGVNDDLESAKALANLMDGLTAFVNLIPLNPIKEFSNERSSSSAIEAFKNLMEKKGIKTTIRKEMGVDIDAGCGQLRKRFISESSHGILS